MEGSKIFCKFSKKFCKLSKLFAKFSKSFRNFSKNLKKNLWIFQKVLRFLETFSELTTKKNEIFDYWRGYPRPSARDIAVCDSVEFLMDAPQRALASVFGFIILFWNYVLYMNPAIRASGDNYLIILKKYELIYLFISNQK